MANYSEIIGRVIRADKQLAAHEFTKAGDPYETLYRWSLAANFRERCDMAEGVYLFGGDKLKGSRAFDNCFEMGDGKRVTAELIRRAETKPALAAAIAEDFGGTMPPQWLANAAREAAAATAQLALL